jgi:hypothetical protein
MGYTVLGFIDKRASEIGLFNNLPVWFLEKVPGEIKEKAVVFVAVKNMFDHNLIVKKLLQYNFNRIIYKPYSVLINDPSNEDNDINLVYEDLYSGLGKYEYNIPMTYQVDVNYIKDYAIISQNDENVTALIPLDFIFFNGGESWNNVNILTLFTHLDLFDFFSGNVNKSCESYLDCYCIPSARKENITISDSWKQNVLHNRAMIYEQMNIALHTDRDFFNRNAVEAVWNRNGYFLLKSGKHRVSFLISKGYYYIPLVLLKNDYELFLNRPCMEPLLNFITDILSWDVPLTHPYFYRIPGIKNSFYYGIIKLITDHFAKGLLKKYNKIDFSKLAILDMTNDQGTISAFFMRMGSNVFRFGEKSELFTLNHALGHIKKEVGSVTDYSINMFDLVIIDLEKTVISKEYFESLKFYVAYIICKEDTQLENILNDTQKIKLVFNSVREDGLIKAYIFKPAN